MSSIDQLDPVQLVLITYRSILSPFAYASMPITSGHRLYQVLEKHGIETLDELMHNHSEIFHKEVVYPNSEDANKFAKSVKAKTKLPMLAPAMFEANGQRWKPEEYMSLWLQVVAEKVREMYMIEDWQYSNGAAEEFARAIEAQFGFFNPLNGMDNLPNNEKAHEEAYIQAKKIKVYDHNGDEIKIDEGFELITRALKSLDGRGFQPEGLCTAINQLYEIGEFYKTPTVRTKYTKQAPYEYDWDGMLGNFEEIEDIILATLHPKQDDNQKT
jgi:hypothetical protein